MLLMWYMHVLLLVVVDGCSIQSQSQAS